MKCEDCGLEYQKSGFEQVEPSHPRIDCARELKRKLDELKAGTPCRCAEEPEKATYHVAECAWAHRAIRKLHGAVK